MEGVKTLNPLRYTVRWLWGITRPEFGLATSTRPSPQGLSQTTLTSTPSDSKPVDDDYHLKRVSNDAFWIFFWRAWKRVSRKHLNNSFHYNRSCDYEAKKMVELFWAVAQFNTSTQKSPPWLKTSSAGNLTSVRTSQREFDTKAQLSTMAVFLPMTKLNCWTHYLAF